ncbi:MAG: hypothetical protein IPJ01_12045 [Micavibrio sp.]|nr:hypothetical protein [Micavibrio sp.]
MKNFDILKETETGGVKSYVVTKRGAMIAHGMQSRAVETGGAFANADTLFFTTGFQLLDGSMIRVDGNVYRVASIGLQGMAGLKRYEGQKVDA